MDAIPKLGRQVMPPLRVELREINYMLIGKITVIAFLLPTKRLSTDWEMPVSPSEKRMLGVDKKIRQGWRRRNGISVFFIDLVYVEIGLESDLLLEVQGCRLMLD
ncbi:hypothetical protein K2173_010167 (mitochondrion) [Erythroxylum novogranatense]|uniref:Uncharacterized protein n=1 Tax=Erythroxylum novogranatense TaxID=1862640 RepID=A0AAV8S4A4_9ROSI|nr:hypothetical protein K2173_010167 [Erythroxylum novogranatense]